MAQVMRRTHQQSREACGARTLSQALRRAGFAVGRHRAATFMRRLDMTARKKRFHHYRRNTKPLPAPNLLARQFDPAIANRVWAGDITFVPTGRGWLYLAIVVDLFSRRIIGWATGLVADARLARQASELAFAARQPRPGLMFHSDQGCQYTADLFVAHLKDKHAVQSMSGKGNCWDNAVVERVFRTLKHEWIADRVYGNRDEARQDILAFIARYNHRRLHSALNYVPPAEFEVLAT
jgi:transposase InsO family protein